MEQKPISGHTGLYYLIGSPVEHSVSPAMHNAAFELLGLDSRYVAFDVPLETLDTAVAGMKVLGIKGWNVTMPDKSRMAELCDELSTASRICGACNTVRNDGGKLYGTTTDGSGWVESARADGVEPTGSHVVQLGSGGAGTSILVQTAIDGARQIDLFIRPRLWEQMSRMAARLNRETSCRVEMHHLEDADDLKTSIQRADILLNTTPVGMAKTPGSIVTDKSWFHKGLAVMDVIYEPRETELMRLGREAGCFAANGMYMLLYQGAAAFKIWTGEDMPVEAIKAKFFAG